MAKGEYLGLGVVATIGVGLYTGHQLRGVFLEEYDEVTDSYVGVTHFQDDQFTKTFQNIGKGVFAEGRTANVAVAVRIPGLRRYPYTERPGYAFQFVLPGEDSEPLRAIMAGNAAAPEQAVEEVVEAVPAAAQDNSPLWQRLGFASKEEWKAAGKPQA